MSLESPGEKSGDGAVYCHIRANLMLGDSVRGFSVDLTSVTRSQSGAEKVVARRRRRKCANANSAEACVVCYQYWGPVVL
ncbi:hypothetical protein SAMN06265373_103276 [Shimia sagamensis]|uniref:Uncharacterized protein n=1 Tax=Shimia sagamensis TaxID=1566352 RepID=A0ABY1NUL6_9RHOB|nr:hypothetical protein SAMN06265373_103276 [Shimia sagamensis]